MSKGDQGKGVHQPPVKTSSCLKAMPQNIQCPDIPQGLIEPSSTVPVKLNGISCNALLDSGSQVITLFESWYRQHLAHVPIHPVTGFAIWGVSNTIYPYFGYVVLDLEFPSRSGRCSRKDEGASTCVP